MRKRFFLPRFFALWLTLCLALPNPAYALRQLNAGSEENSKLVNDLTRALRPTPSAEAPLARAAAGAEEEVKLLTGGHTNAVNGIAFGPAANQLISGSTDASVVFWDSGSVSRKVKGAESVTAVAGSPDGNRIVIAPRGTVEFYNAQGVRIRFEQAEPLTERLLFSRDGKLLVSLGRRLDNAVNVRIWDGETFVRNKLLILPKETVDIALHPEGKEVVALLEDGRLQAWNLAPENPKAEALNWVPSVRNVVRIAYHPSGNSLVLGTQGGVLVNLDRQTGRELWAGASFKPADGFGEVRALAFSPDPEGKLLAVGGREAALVDSKTGTILAAAPYTATSGRWYFVDHVAFSPDGSSLTYTGPHEGSKGPDFTIAVWSGLSKYTAAGTEEWAQLSAAQVAGRLYTIWNASGEDPTILNATLYRVSPVQIWAALYWAWDQADRSQPNYQGFLNDYIRLILAYFAGQAGERFDSSAMESEISSHLQRDHADLRRIAWAASADLTAPAADHDALVNLAVAAADRVLIPVADSLGVIPRTTEAILGFRYRLRDPIADWNRAVQVHRTPGLVRTLVWSMANDLQAMYWLIGQSVYPAEGNPVGLDLSNQAQRDFLADYVGAILDYWVTRGAQAPAWWQSDPGRRRTEISGILARLQPDIQQRLGVPELRGLELKDVSAQSRYSGSGRQHLKVLGRLAAHYVVAPVAQAPELGMAETARAVQQLVNSRLFNSGTEELTPQEVAARVDAMFEVLNHLRNIWNKVTAGEGPGYTRIVRDYFRESQTQETLRRAGIPAAEAEELVLSIAPPGSQAPDLLLSWAGPELLDIISNRYERGELSRAAVLQDIKVLLALSDVKQIFKGRKQTPFDEEAAGRFIDRLTKIVGINLSAAGAEEKGTPEAGRAVLRDFITSIRSTIDGLSPWNPQKPITDLADSFPQLRQMAQQAGYKEGVAQSVWFSQLSAGPLVQTRNVFVQRGVSWNQQKEVEEQLAGYVTFVDSPELADLIIGEDSNEIQLDRRQAFLQVNDSTARAITPGLLKHLEEQGLLNPGSVVVLDILLQRQGDAGEDVLLFA